MKQKAAIAECDEMKCKFQLRQVICVSQEREEKSKTGSCTKVYYFAIILHALAIVP